LDNVTSAAPVLVVLGSTTIVRRRIPHIPFFGLRRDNPKQRTQRLSRLAFAKQNSYAPGG
jgi:hypothetical protein